MSTKTLSPFDYQPTLKDGELLLRPLVQADFKGLEQAASDPLIWEQHPSKDRTNREGFAKYFAYLISSKHCLVLDLDGEIIGCSSFYDVPNEPSDIGIGYTFITRDYWGGDMNWRVKSLMFEHVFQSRDRVLFHIDPANFRSQQGTAKFGAKHLYDGELDLGTGVESFKVYEVLAQEWNQKKDRI